MGMVHYIMLNKSEQRLLTIIQFLPAIRFSHAIRFYKPTSGVIVNNNRLNIGLALTYMAYGF